MGSSRLPGKTTADICGRPLIQRVVERVKAARLIDEVVVATTNERADDDLARLIEKEGWCKVFRGPELDVLQRYALCARAHDADIVVRITADDPLKDPELVDRAVGALRSDIALDYYSNTLQPTYPEGLDVEAVREVALARAHEEARLPSDREHVTPFIWRQPGLFRTGGFVHERNLSHWRWTVDREVDLRFMRTVYGHFKACPLVGFRTVIEWLDKHPDVAKINSGIPRNEGYIQSLRSEGA